MRPVKLTITAFGPYATQQIIDFAELQGRNLFVITGDTGAGKTTILDAIAYALYGRASGRDRDGESLRSHFAAPDLMTSIEMEFELGGQGYWVQRIPKQRKKKTRGEGYTDQNVDAEFKALDGRSRVVSGVKEVNEKIVELMGLSYEQFKQIIMIPQGEFRELLNAESKVRQDILQKIFGTEGFRRVQELFDSQAKALTQEVSQLESQRNESIRSLDGSGYLPLKTVLALADFNIPQVVDEAKRAIEQDVIQANELQAQVNEQEQRVAVKQKDIFQGQANNLKLSMRDGAYQKKIAIEAGQPQINEKKIKLQLARKALGLAGVDEYRYSRGAYVQKTKLELGEVIQQVEKAKIEAARSQSNYQLEKAKEGKRNELLIENARLQALTSKVADWDVRQTKVAGLVQDLAKVKTKRDTTKQQLEKTRNELKNCQLGLDQARVAATEYASKVLELEKTNEIYGKLGMLKVENDRLSTVQQFAIHLAEQEAEQGLEYQRGQAAYTKAQNLFLEGQASRLASKLIGGDPCPVCGSAHHPQLAKMIDTIISETDLQKLIHKDKQAKELYDEVKSKHQRSKADEYAQRQILTRLQQEVDLLVHDDLREISSVQLTKYLVTTLPEYQLIRQRLQDESKKLATQKQDEQQLAATLSKQAEMISILMMDVDRLEVQYTELFAQVASAKDAMKELEAEVPPAVRSTAALAAALGKIQKEFQVMKQALVKAEEELGVSQVRYATAMAEKKGIEKALATGEEELIIAQQNFRAALHLAGFHEEADYVTAKLTETGITSLENEINDFQERLRSALDYFSQMVQEVEGLMVVDVATLEAEQLTLQTEKNQFITQRTIIIARQIHNQTMLASICSLLDNLAQKDEEYQVIGHLARIARGDNEQKVSFERYVLAAFFNDIIDAANARLRKMTGGRYQMSRITQKGKGSGQSGLEIEVFDYYTGQARHVKTLSGGESFKASLALALGLAEVVQSYAGGISLETMFVDEGFGTLDPESLDTAIGCLIELQHSGRLVGIISHVPELKTSVDARLEIEACKDGSRARFCIM